MIDYLLWALTGFGILFLVVCAWVLVSYWLTPHVESPDGTGRITGACGDTMEISLKFKGDRVVQSSHWTDGCAYSLNCACAAADLAKGKTPDEILEIDPETIQNSVGGLPRDQIHCAQLAYETLLAALDHYMRRNRICPRP